ncbi:mononuclear molybdenum enzyme YedY, partial [Corynebacterium propinquum]
MLIKLPKASDCHESDVTPESFYLSRRSLLGGALAGIAATVLPRWASAGDASRYADVEPGKAPAWFAEKLSGAKWQAVT